MRYMVLSDIHGGRDALRKALSFKESLGCKRIILLGDILNHGPRNAVPADYDPPAVAADLNRYSHEIIAIRGNCDSEVDGMMLNFHLDAPYAYLDFPLANGTLRRVMLTHGHLYPLADEEQTKSEKIRDRHGLSAGDTVLSGHTHIAGIIRHNNGIVNINPGSVTIPKGGTEAGFAVLSAEGVTLFNINGEKVQCCTL